MHYTATPPCTGRGSFNDLVGTGEDQRRNIKADRARGLEVDHELELSWLLDRHLGRISTFENAIHEIGSPSPHRDNVGPKARQQTK